MRRIPGALKRAIVRVGWSSSTPAGLVALFVAGLIIRAALAPSGGFPGDLLVFQHWEQQVAGNDWSQFTDPSTFVYYPYLYVLYGLGQLTRFAFGTAPTWTLLKIPPIIGDLGLAAVTALLAERLAPEKVRRQFPIRGLAAAAILLNPAVFFLSALWGQVDSIGALLVMVALLLVATGPSKLYREALAAGLFGLALGIKPQVAVVLPLLLLVLVRRHLPGNAFRDRHRLGIAAARIGGLAGLMLAVVLIAPAPFGLDPLGVLQYYANAPTYAFTSANAFNLWGALAFWVPDLAGPAAYTILGVPAFWIGVGLFALGTAAVLVLAWRALGKGEVEGRVMVFGCAALTCLSFALLTRGHERYLFVAVPCLAIMIGQRPLRRALVILSGLYLANLYFPYVFFVEYFGQHTWVKVDYLYRVLFGTEQDSVNKKVLSVAIVIICLGIAIPGWRWLAGLPTVPPRVLTWWRATATWRQRLYPAPATTPGPSGAPWWQRRAHLALVALACGVNLWALNGEATPVHDLNDSAYHFAMLRWARAKIDQGKLPLDGWYPNLGLGLAQFHHYQSLPHVIGAYVSVVAGEATTFYWSLYLLLALWPISIYICARLMGWDGWTAAAAALVSPLLVSAAGYGYEQGTYTWRGYGVWSQLWGMWLLPLAWGLSWRAVKGVGSYALAALAVALTVAVHFVTGYLALLSIGIWALVSPREFLRRLRRVLVVGVGAILVGSWVILPLIQDSAYASNTEFERGTYFYDSFGAAKILGWLFTGEVFDHGRFPVVTLLVAVGVAVCIVRFRRDEKARALLGVWALSLLLWFGRPTLGPFLKLLPGSDDLPLHRYIMGVQLGGILLAGVGAAWLGQYLVGTTRRYLSRRVWRYLPPVKPAVAGALITVVGIAALYPAWSQIAGIDQQGTTWIAQQVAADSTDGADFAALVGRIPALGPGRVYAGSSSNWGRQYLIGAVPAYAELQNSDVDTIGFWLRTVSLSADVETLFDDTNPAQYDLFNVRYLVLPRGMQPPVKATLIDSQGRHTLWHVDTSGYLEVVDAAGPPITADRMNIGGQTRPFDNSPLLAAHVHPMIAFNGAPAAPNTIVPGETFNGPAGSVTLEASNPDDGTFVGQVVANRPAVVMLKTTFEPRWHVTVDGVDVQPQMIAPDFVGATVSAGRHTIRFEYMPINYYPALLALGLVTLVGLQFGPRAIRRLLLR